MNIRPAAALRRAASLVFALMPPLSAAAGLKGLALLASGGVDLVPAFSAQVTSYRAQVPGDVSDVFVQADTVGFATRVHVSVDGRPGDSKAPTHVRLDVGENRIDIAVVSALGRDAGHYRIVVEREDVLPVAATFLRRTFVDAQAGRAMPYRLYVPSAGGTKRSYPLVVFLHGGGERGDDNERPLVANQGGLAWAKPQEQAQRPAYVLVPQARPTWDGGFARVRNAQNHGDFKHAFEASEDLLTAGRLLQQVLAEFPDIDRKRIYLTGISEGGLGSWAWSLLQPDLFAAIVPVCGGADPAAMSALRHLPVWAFHAAADPVVPVSLTRNAIEALRAAGGQPRYTEYDRSTYLYPTAHFSWVPAYRDEEMRAWLFRQSR